MFRDTLNTVTKYGCQIVTVDPPTKRIEGVIKDGTVRQVSVFATEPIFRWPKVGENWMIKQENGYWVLDGIYQEEEDKILLTDVNEGDVHINTGSGRVLLNTGNFLMRKHTHEVESGATKEFLVEHGLNDHIIQVTAVNAETYDPINAFTWETTEDPVTKKASLNTIKVIFSVAPSEGAVVIVTG